MKVDSYFFRSVSSIRLCAERVQRRSEAEPDGEGGNIGKLANTSAMTLDVKKRTHHCGKRCSVNVFFGVWRVHVSYEDNDRESREVLENVGRHLINTFDPTPKNWMENCLTTG